MIFGVAVVFPVGITFGVAGVLAERHAQAPVQGFFSVVIKARRTATGAVHR